MQVAMLTMFDCAAAGHEMMQAVNSIGKHNVRLIAASKPPYQYKFDVLAKRVDRKVISDIIWSSDIIHFKGDHLPADKFAGVTLPKDKPIIISVEGSKFRRHGVIKRAAAGWYPFERYISTSTYRSALTPDLNYPGFQGHYTQQAIDSTSKEITCQVNAIPVICHSPSNREVKGTNTVFLPAMKILKRKGYRFEVDIIENRPNEKVIERKKQADILFDQAYTGYYGVASLEAMQYGIPVVCYISEASIAQADGKIGAEFPVQIFDGTVEGLVKVFERLLTSDLTNLSCLTKAWCDNFHSYETVGKMWTEIYDQLINEK